jgi:hypothetical protein
LVTVSSAMASATASLEMALKTSAACVVDEVGDVG